MTVMRYNYKEVTEFIDFAESYGFNVSFQRIRGIFGDQNFFEMADVSALNELRSIIMNEQLKKRNINVFWGDLLEFEAEKVNTPSLLSRTLAYEKYALKGHLKGFRDMVKRFF